MTGVYNSVMPEVLSLKDMEAPFLLERCTGALVRGGLVILPTDTVYGLAARVDVRKAVERIFELKGREAGKALVVMVSSREEAAGITAPGQRESLMRLGSLWPGPLTLIVRAGDVAWRDNVAAGAGTLGIRVPNSPFLIGLLDKTGPLAVTSANLAGEEAPGSFEDVDKGMLCGVELAVDGGECGSGRPSTVAEIHGDSVRILRRGETGEEDLYRALGGG